MLNPHIMHVRYNQLTPNLERLTLASEADETASDDTPPSTTATKKDSSLEFFSRFPNFTQNTENPISVEFYRLADHRGWKVGSKKWKKNWNVCMAQQFDLLIGKRTRDIGTWRKMCEKLEIAGEFPSIRQCKKALNKVHVNIVDLLDCWDKDKCPRLFKSQRQLARYSQEKALTFPREVAKQDKVVGILLRHMNG